MNLHPDFDIPGTKYPDDDPFGDLLIASQNYWAGKTGREDPPAPSYREVNGKVVLGRYMDIWGCQGHMRAARMRWRKWYLGFYSSALILVVFTGVDFVIAFFWAPLAAVIYFIMRGRLRHQFNMYYDIQEKMLATGEPEWVPFDKDRLKLINETPGAIWP